MAVRVNTDNFARAETERMMASLQTNAGGVNRLSHSRVPTAIDQQPVIRMNRDTLYSFAVVDISEGATLLIPDAGDRYVSVMIVNQDHYINRVFHQPGEHALSVEEFDTPWVTVAVRTLVDPADPRDVAEANALQDQFAIAATSAKPFAPADHDFGAKDAVDPVRHLLGTAAGWGGLPDEEASYIGVAPGKSVGQYSLTVRDVPVDGFWSISVYNADGYFEANDRNAYSVNNITATPNDDGSITVNFGGCGDERPNCLAITEGWNYTIRLYRPRAEVLDGTWTFPAI